MSVSVGSYTNGLGPPGTQSSADSHAECGETWTQKIKHSLLEIPQQLPGMLTRILLGRFCLKGYLSCSFICVFVYMCLCPTGHSAVSPQCLCDVGYGSHIRYKYWVMAAERGSAGMCVRHDQPDLQVHIHTVQIFISILEWTKQFQSCIFFFKFHTFTYWLIAISC